MFFSLWIRETRKCIVSLAFVFLCLCLATKKRSPPCLPCPLLVAAAAAAVLLPLLPLSLLPLVFLQHMKQLFPYLVALFLPLLSPSSFFGPFAWGRVAEPSQDPKNDRAGGHRPKLPHGHGRGPRGLCSREHALHRHRGVSMRVATTVTPARGCTTATPPYAG